MDITNINASASNPAYKNGDAIAISMQKKAMDLQAQNAAQLIEAAQVQNTPTGSLGSKIDVYA